MKKLLFLFLLVLTGVKANAQTNVVTFTLNQQPCNNDGIVTANLPAILIPPVTVNWYVGNNPIPVSQTTSTLTDVLNNYSGGQLWVVATGSNTTSAYGSFSAPPFTITYSTTPAACPSMGTATATVTGGTAPYTYQWYDASTQAVVSTTNPASLPSGAYGLTVTDANNCVSGSAQMADSIYISNQSPFSVTVSTTQANCTNGTATVTNVSAGTPPYSYLWSNNATTPGITGLSMGGYNVTVTDANNCQASSYAYVTQAINIGANVTTTPATCIQTNGAVTAFGSGGQPPYTYQWSNNVNSQSQSNIPGGSYQVTVTDANGCFGTGYGYVNSSTPINVTQSTTPSSCTSPTGTATLSISGGTAPYVVTWNTFPVQTGTTVSNLSPGTYSFNVMDAVGCVRNGSVVINPVNIINGSFTSTAPSCTQANGSLSFTPTGGATPYTYSWSNSGSTQTINNLASGYYTVTVTDNAGCSKTFTKHLAPSSPVTLGLATTPASCMYTNDGSITANVFGGTTPYTYNWSVPGTTNTVSNLGEGYYNVSVTDANGCTAYTSTHLPYNPAGTACYCTISGTVYNDANANCVQDAGENGIPNIQIHCSGFGYTYTNVQGNYSFKVPTGSYTISESVLGYYPLAACQNNNIQVNVTAAPGCTQTVNFANTTATIHDLHVSTWKYNCPVPGFNYNMVTIISNQGTVPEAGIVGGKQTDIQLNAPLLTPSTQYNGGSGGYYNFTTGALTLNPGASKTIFMDFTVPTNLPINTSLVFKDTVAYMAPITNWINDYSPWNNVKYYTAGVVSSYDPNFKEVHPRGDGPTGLIKPADSVLEYMVHFQNLGNYKATNVVVVDTLDADLDWTTLRPMYQSHKCVITVSEGGVAKFTFNNINLPAKMFDEPGSNGMLSYTIRRKNVPLGTQFTNTAAIYFDYNEPVITNTTVNTLHDPMSVETVESADGGFAIYPNPASNTVNVSVKVTAPNTKTELKIVGVSGEVLIRKNVTLDAGQQTIQFGVESLTPGIYFMSLAANGSTQTEKFVIMK